jgi:hypothetical protein
MTPPTGQRKSSAQYTRQLREAGHMFAKPIGKSPSTTFYCTRAAANEDVAPWIALRLALGLRGTTATRMRGGGVPWPCIFARQAI